MSSELNQKLSFNRSIWIFMLLMVLLTTVLRVLLVFSYNSNLEGIEEFSVFLTQMTVENGSFYSPNQETCIFIPYSPLYYDFTAWCFSLIFQDSKVEPFSIYRTGRLLNLVYNILSFLIVILISYFLRLSLKKSVLIGVVYFILLTPHQFAVRPDSLRSLFAAISFISMLLYVIAERPRLLFLSLSALATAVAIALKTDAVQLVLVYTLYILVFAPSRIRHYLIFFAPVLIIVYCIIAVAVDGVDYNNMALGLFSGFSVEYFLLMIGLGFLLPFSPWILKLLQLHLTMKPFTWNTTDKLIGTGLFVTFFSSLVFSLRLGSAPVYFSDFMLFAVVAVGANWERVFNRRRWITLASITVLVKLILLCRLTTQSMETENKNLYFANKEIAGQIKCRLLPDEYAYAYNHQVNLFLFDKMTALKHELELTKFQLYQLGIHIDLNHHPKSETCQMPKVVAVPLEDWVNSTDYFYTFWPELTPVDTINRYVLLQSR